MKDYSEYYPSFDEFKNMAKHKLGNNSDANFEDSYERYINYLSLYTYDYDYLIEREKKKNYQTQSKIDEIQNDYDKILGGSLLVVLISGILIFFRHFINEDVINIIMGAAILFSPGLVYGYFHTRSQLRELGKENEKNAIEYNSFIMSSNITRFK